MTRLYQHGTVCPMCNGSEQNKFVWSDMLHRYICWLCSVELCVDFYPSPDNNSDYFLRVSELLGYDEWVCRRLYIQEVLMYRSTETEVDVEACKRQMVAINEYLKAINESKVCGDINAAKMILLHKLKDRAFTCKFGEMTI